jgi:hypothetical protein
MNLRIQSGVAHSRQALVCALNLNRPPTSGKPAVNRPSQLSPASSCLAETAFQFPASHQLKGSLDLVELWKQVQKTELSVDFTLHGAKIYAGIFQLNQFQCRWGGS